MNTTPAFQKSYDCYKHLYINLRQIAKRDRFTWGEKCENLAIYVLRDIAQAEFKGAHKKQLVLKRASENLDLLKIFIRLGGELHILNRKQYIARETELQELGRMIGGWLKTP